MNEKINRDHQLKKTQHKRRKEARETLEEEKRFVQKQVDDLEQERLINIEKKK